jgi:hypothetical protein
LSSKSSFTRLLLPDKKKELESFLSRDDMKNSSTAERMTALINYYNSLL